MPERSSRKKDLNETAFAVVAQATGQPHPAPKPEEVQAPEQVKNPAAVALGRLGGLRGGKARAESLSKKERSEIARTAARARWKQD
jgi:hypothetical protein